MCDFFDLSSPTRRFLVFHFTSSPPVPPSLAVFLFCLALSASHLPPVFFPPQSCHLSFLYHLSYLSQFHRLTFSSCCATVINCNKPCQAFGCILVDHRLCGFFHSKSKLIVSPHIKLHPLTGKTYNFCVQVFKNILTYNTLVHPFGLISM